MILLEHTKGSQQTNCSLLCLLLPGQRQCDDDDDDGDDNGTDGGDDGHKYISVRRWWQPDILVWFLLNGPEHIVEDLKKLLSREAVEGYQVVGLTLFKVEDSEM